MKTLLIKDIKKRQQYLNFFFKHQCLKSIHGNENLPQQIRWEAFFLLTQASKKTRSTQLKNRCLISNRSKSIDSSFKISRIFLRKFIAEGLISGAIKSSW